MGITVHTLQALREGKEDLHPRLSSPGRKHCRQRPTERRLQRAGASPQCHLVAESCIMRGPTPWVFSPWMCANAWGRQCFLSGLTSCQTDSGDRSTHTWPHRARPTLTLVYCVLSDVSYILRFHARWETITSLWEERRSRERVLQNEFIYLKLLTKAVITSLCESLWSSEQVRRIETAKTKE